jgi:hypothetical protein
MKLYALWAFYSLAAQVDALPAVDVVSVKPAGGPTAIPGGGLRYGGQGCRNSPGRVNCNFTLSNYLEWAYSVKHWQISGPGWLNSEVYDVAGSGRRDKGILHALGDQLGLRLEARRVPVDILVIGHVKRTPIAN